MTRRHLLFGATLTALLGVTLAEQILTAEPARAYAPGYNYPFTNLPEPSGAAIPTYDASDGFGSLVGRTSEHSGIDLTNLDGQGPIAGRWVYPVRAGTVTGANWEGNLGNTIWVTHDDGRVSRYSHLAEMRISGGAVTPAHVIGTVGGTGADYAPHLHLSIIAGGVLIDPAPIVVGAPFANQVASTPEIIASKDGNMYLIWDTAGGGYLALPGKGLVPVAGITHYMVLKRLINSNQAADNPEIFNAVEINWIKSYLSGVRP